MAFMFYPYPLQKRYGYIVSLFFIWFILISVVSIPTFPYYALLEQVTGIALDFCLPRIYVVLYVQAREAAVDPSEQRIWILVIVATVVHLFGTILPLVVENFVVGQSEVFSVVLEGMIAFAAPVTHILYTRWATLYHRQIAIYPEETPQRFIVSKPECIRKCGAGSCCGGQVALFLFWIILSALIGLIPTTITPAIMGECPADMLTASSATGVCIYAHMRPIKMNKMK